MQPCKWEPGSFGSLATALPRPGLSCGMERSTCRLHPRPWGQRLTANVGIAGCVLPEAWVSFLTCCCHRERARATPPGCLASLLSLRWKVSRIARSPLDGYSYGGVNQHVKMRAPGRVRQALIIQFPGSTGANQQRPGVTDLLLIPGKKTPVGSCLGAAVLQPPRWRDLSVTDVDLAPSFCIPPSPDFPPYFSCC